MIDWIEYYGYNTHAPFCFPDGYEPTVLEEGHTYLVCTENGAVLVKQWFGVDNGGFRTTGARGVSGHSQDSNILYYAELNMPEEIESLKKYDTVQKLAREVIRLKKVIRNNIGDCDDALHRRPDQGR